MRFIETQKSSVDKNKTVYVFKLGQAEVLILQDVLHYLKKVVPQSFFAMPFTSRANQMMKEVDKVVLEHNLRFGRKRPKGWNPQDPTETF